MSKKIDLNEVKKIISICCKLQSVVHDIDELSEMVNFKQELKRNTNIYLKYTESFLKILGRSFDPSEIDYFNKTVLEIDKIGEEIQIEKPKTN